MKYKLGVWLEEKRKEMGMTKGQIAEMIGIAIGQYSAYVSGKSIPRQITLNRISQALSISVEELRQMMNTPAAAVAEPVEQPAAEAPVVAATDSIQTQLAAAQNKVLEGKLDLVLAMLNDISNRLPR